MERDMTKIAQGLERKEDVVLRHVGTVAEVFRLLRLHISLLDQELQRLFPPLSASAAEGHVAQRDFCKCAKCGASMNLMESGGEVGSAELYESGTWSASIVVLRRPPMHPMESSVASLAAIL
ncbi:hypothetical protein Emag_005057 [Eimeria magna]